MRVYLACHVAVIEGVRQPCALGIAATQTGAQHPCAADWCDTYADAGTRSLTWPNGYTARAHGDNFYQVTSYELEP